MGALFDLSAGTARLNRLAGETEFMKLNAVASSAPTADLASLASRLEAAGCDGLYFAELGHDPFLGAAVASTGCKTMSLGTGIALAFPRGPVLLAYTAHDLNTASGGNFVLGLGPQVRAHIERRFGMVWSEPVARMHELVRAIRAVWACWADNGPLAFNGEFYKLSLMPPNFRPEPTAFAPPPICLAAVGPKMAEMAGEVADGLFIHAFATPDYVRGVILPAVERGLAKSGRSRNQFQMIYSGFIADSADPKAVAAARNSVAFYASTKDYRGVLDQHGLGHLQPRLQQMTREGKWQEMAGLISDEVLDLFCVAGAPDAIGAGLAKRWGGLADQISLDVGYWNAHENNPLWTAAAEKLRLAV
jgi:probable F420-dependent oxidoreductase